nr:hypothetical protein [uncultured Campylobacter sp.]
MAIFASRHVIYDQIYRRILSLNLAQISAAKFKIFDILTAERSLRFATILQIYVFKFDVA